jgi:hypothetical protein
MISVLSLVVAALAVFFGPVVAWANVQRQIQVAAREAWMREFREQVAAFRDSFEAFVLAKPDEEAKSPEARLQLDKEHREMRHHYMVLRLLIAEKGQRYQDFIQKMGPTFSVTQIDQMIARVGELISAAADILQRERAAIETDPGAWRTVRTDLGLEAAPWRPWSQLMAWLRRGPPRFPT